MKFSTKLILSFTAVTLLLLAIGIASQFLNSRVQEQVVEENDRAIRELKLSGEMEVSLYRSLINTQYFLENRYRQNLSDGLSDADLNTEYARERVREAFLDFNESLLAAEESLLSRQEPGGASPDLNSKVLGQLKSRFEIYASLVDQFIPLAEQDYEDGKEFFTVTIEPYFRTNLLPLVDRLREETQNNLDQEITKLNSELSDTGKILAAATAGAFLLSLILVYVLYQSLATPLQKLSEATKHIGAGNLNKRIEVYSNDEVGQLGMEFNRMAENLSNTTVSKNFMDDIIESMADALIVTDEHSHIQRVNSATVDMLGYTEKELIGKPIFEIIADDRNTRISEIDSVEVFKNYETSYLSKDGSVIPVSLSRAQIHDNEENVRGLVCVASDITQRKIAEEQISKSLREKEILLAEIHHRVKNNLAVISGLLQMQIWETEDEAAESVLRDSQLRVRSIALVHEKLYQSESLSYIEFDKYIRDLLQAISSTYVDSAVSVKLNTELEDIALNINQAIPCSLLLNELVINAYKHAFAETMEGEISVLLRRNGSDESIFMSVKDNGKGLGENFDLGDSRTLGMSLVHTLARQLKGEINAYNDNGAVFEIRFEQDEVVSAD